MVNDGTSRYRQSDPGHAPRPAEGRSNAADPLAELARMMAQEDEFAALMREVPRQPQRPAAPPPRPQAPVASPRPSQPQPAPQAPRAPSPAAAPRPAAGSFAALAAEVYTESAQRAAAPAPAPAPRAERPSVEPGQRPPHPGEPYAREARPAMPPRPAAPVSAAAAAPSPAPRAPVAPPAAPVRAPVVDRRPPVEPAPAPRAPARAEPAFEQPAAPPPSWMSRANQAPADRDTTFDLGLDREDDVYDYGRTSGDDEAYGAEADEDFGHEAAAPRRNRRRLLMAGAALAVLVVGGAGAYAFLRSGGTSTIAGGQPPVIRAEQAPNKVVPAPTQTAETTSDGQKLIYDRVGGTGSTGSEKVVSSEEQPVDVSQAAQPQPRVIAPAPSSRTPVATAPSGTEPKRVRTLTVRADGSIVEGDPAPTPAAAVATTPQSPQPTASAAVALSPGTASPVSTNPAPLAATPSIVPNVPAPPTRVATAPSQAAPAPAANVTQTLNAAANSVPTASGAYVVQIGSVPSEADAQAMLRSALTRYPSLLGGKPASVRRGDISSTGGTTYRAQIGAFTNRADAVNLCEQLKSQGGNCFVSRL
ncbi:SPOR domain-containing protein [Ancylobacter oerskovii]|uniref:SPOR domain-containing protein n=1 Tax=Ancylobacter oerskovii TaxID=459519 RepID=A0ABW4Z371_9HYPH|nr:SPOR domain-containing protein [Ancylobacter oerskovii]MBS7546303.1 SPOR domain-containing protein [Ancylobacter oerskovii]